MKYLKLLWALYLLKKNTSKTAEQIQRFQKKKLKKILHYAWKNSNYYQNAFKKVGIKEKDIDKLPLSAFPTLDKTMLLENFDQLITVSDINQDELYYFDTNEEMDRKPFKGKYHVVHSSGSTGKPRYFIYDENGWRQMLIGIIRAALWNMSMLQIIRLLVRGPHIAYIAATDGRYGGAMAVGDGIDGVGAKQLHLDIKTPLSEWILKIREFNPNIIIGYPSAIKILGELVEKGEVHLNVVRIISCGEPLGPSLRHYLEEVFHAKVINFYGASESLALGVEVDPKEGMLLFDDMNVIEVRNGNMYLTSLYNFAQPLIRYQISDRLTLEKPYEKSSCPFTRAIGLLGRHEDVLWFEDANGNREFLHPLAIEGFCIEGLKDYQFYQIGKNAFEMIAEISEAVSQDFIRREMKKEMDAIFYEKKLDYVEFYVNFTDKIRPNTGTGKKNLIITDYEKEGYKK